MSSSIFENLKKIIVGLLYVELNVGFFGRPLFLDLNVGLVFVGLHVDLFVVLLMKE